MTAFELAGKLKLDSSEFTSSLGKQESAFKKFGNKISNTSKMISKIAKASVVAGTIMFTKSSIQEGLNFDKAMSQVAATLGKTMDEVQDLAKFARDMGAKTAFSATEAAEALNYMALAGYDSEKSMKMLPTVLNLAAAGGIDLAKASDMVTDAQSALGLSIEETERMVDQMAKTSSKTNTSVEQLGDAFLTVGGTAKMMGKGSIDTTTELSMALGVLADNGIKGAEGGTMLRNILLSLSAPTDKAAKKLKQLGVEVFDSSGEMRDLPFILEDINKATQDMTDQERTDFLSEIFNKRDLKAIEALLGTDMSRWEQLFNDIGNAEGSAEKMAETQLDNLAGDLTIFKSALSEARISISDKLSPTLRKFVQRGTQWVQRLTNAFNEKGLSGAIGEAKTIVKELITESLGLGSDASWADIGRAAAEKLKNGLKSALGKSKVGLANLLGLTDDSGQAIDDPSDVSWLNIAKAAAKNLKENITSLASDAKIKIADMLGVEDAEDASWSDIAGKVVERVKGKFTDTKIKIADFLGVEDPEDATWGDIAGNITTRIKGKIGDARIKIADLLGIEDAGDATWGDIAGKIQERLKGGLSSIKLKAADLLGLESPEDATWADIGKNMMDGLTKYISNKGNFLKQLVLGDEYTDKSTWLDVGEKVSGWLNEAFADGGILDAILGNTIEKATAIATFAGNLISGIASWISTNSAQVADLVTSFATAVTTAAPKIVEALKTILSNPDFQNSFAQLIKAGFEAAMELLGSLMEMLGDTIGRAIFGDEWYEMKSKEKQRVQSETGSYKEGDEDWNARASAIDEKYGMHVTAGTDATGAETDAMTATMTHFGIGGIPTWWSEYGQLKNLVNLRKMASEMGSPELYEASTAGLRAWGDAWGEGLRKDDLTAKVQEAFDGVAPEVTPTVKVDKDSVDTLLDYLNSLGATVHVKIAYSDDDGTSGEVTESGASHSFAKGLWDVPYDDYYARLHRGETVLSASQARDYKEGNSGYGTSEIVSALQSLRNDLSNLQLVVGRKTFGRAVVNYGGSRMSDYIGGSDSRLAAGYGT